MKQSTHAIRPRRRLREVRRDESGVTAIEFAIIAPVLMLLLFGIFEFATIMLLSSLMESATDISARLGKTGYTTDGESRSDTILDAVKNNTKTLINTANLTISSESYGAFNDIGQPEPYTDTNHNGHYDAGEPYTDINGNGKWDADMGAAGYGNAGDIVVYTVSYPWHVMTPVLNNIVGNHGVFTVTAHAVVKNEPYDD